MSDIEHLANELQISRKTVRTLYAAHYSDVINPHMETIRNRMQLTGEPVLLATFECAKLIGVRVQRMLCLAAGLELVAPS